MLAAGSFLGYDTKVMLSGETVVLAWIELAMIDFSLLAPEFALLFGVADLRALRRPTRLTVRSGNRVEVVIA